MAREADKPGAAQSIVYSLAPMDQTALYTMIRNAGFTVLVFEDHPQFFGNWRAHIKRGQNIYEVVSDNREGWLTLWSQVNGQRQKLFEIESYKLGQEQELALVEKWLDAITNDLNLPRGRG